MKLETYLASLGFTDYERATISTLARNESMTASLIVKGSGVPQGKIYSVLNSLRDKGIVEIAPTSPKEYLIPDIVTALARHLEKEKEAIAGKESALEEIELPSRTRKREAPSVRVLAGRQEHLAMIASLYDSAEKEVMQITPLFIGNLSTKKSRIRAAGRGVRIQILTKDITDKNRSNVESTLKAGIAVKSLEEQDILSLLIVDRKRILLGVQNYRRGEERLTLYSTNVSLIQTLIETFERLWKKGRTMQAEKNVGRR